MMTATYHTLRWQGDASGTLLLIDQTRLPAVYEEIECHTVEQVWQAIRSLQVRGAPAIGVAAAYGVVVGTQTHRSRSANDFMERVSEVVTYLATSRPTAVNLFWALERMKSVATAAAAEPHISAAGIHDRLLQEARAIDLEDQSMCAAIGKYGSQLLRSGTTVMTHCNAGGLATAGDGTALAVIFAAASSGKSIQVVANETRPLLQGARLTAWELQRRGIPVTLICDSMAAQVMKEGKVGIVITGADRIAANGDTANKIGTYGIAVLAEHHGIPFCIAAPSSTFDLSLPHGSHIPIEQRPAAEITHFGGQQTAPEGVGVYNPAFDVTPAELIHALITEHGIIQNPNTESIRRFFQHAPRAGAL